MLFRILILLLTLCLLSCEDSSKKNDTLAIVTVFIKENCSVSEYMCLPLRNAYHYFCDTLQQNISFQGFVPSPISTDSTIAQFKQEYSIPFSIERDWDDNSAQSQIGGPGVQTLSFGATVTPEIFIEFNEQIVYSGMIDNSYMTIGQWSEPTENYLFEILMKIINNEPIINTQTTAIGCIINN